MEYDPTGLEWLFRTFDRMHHNYIKAELIKRGFGEASHPPILFMLKFEAKDMTASQKEIADAIGISPPTVAISLKRMQKAGLVQKASDEKDLRRNHVTITEKGLQLVDECAAVFGDVEQGIFNNFSEKEREQLKGFYIRMIQNLESMGAQLPARFKRSF